MNIFDPRTLSEPVYKALSDLRRPYEEAWQKATREIDKKIYYNHLKEQKNQAIELYTYISTWGLMRCKAEEKYLDKRKLGEPEVTRVEDKAKIEQYGKREVIQKYFSCLENLAASSDTKDLATDRGLDVLKGLQADEYLGLMGLGLELANEFSFWANAVYHDIKGDQ
ncbi:hypothetical protein [Oscillatoria sp. FACHB-1406]|uniref:hypothetical protein n=1 Tax=Oscillatoria sp. FACHB-1406 TaxID=2692846 RepID=UPI0016822CCD|nr:hypothetical protein [Oscillatoria sp. FACHB-1406]MBD2576996.1 hypothetical protein [Oscillatoria sp. FACHB-1406]